MLVRAEPQRDAPAAADSRRGGSQSGMRVYNERLVLSLIRQHGSLPKAEIARLTGLSAQTCSVIVKGLEADGLLRKEKPQRGRVGQPSVPFSLNPEGSHSIGLKIGRRSADVVLMNLAGTVIARHRQPYRYPEPQGLFEFAEASWLDLESRLPRPDRTRISGLGTAMPGEIWNWAQEVGALPGILDQWRTLDVEQELAARSPWPVFVQNDATAACAAELTFGVGEHHRDFLYFFVGSFIGGGLVMDGRLVTGRSGNAGALGSILVPDGGGGARQLIQCASIFTLERRIEEAGGDPQMLWNDDDSWNGLGGIIETWIGEAARNIAVAIVSTMAVIDLETVVIDGSFPSAVRGRLRTAVNRAVARLDRQGLGPFQVIDGTIGRDARAVGGATLPLLANFAIHSELFLKRPAG